MRTKSEFDNTFFILLNQIKDVTREEAEQKIKLNGQNLERLLAGESDSCFEVYFEYPEKGICAIKYQAKPVVIRSKSSQGTYLVGVPPYLELSDISVLPEFQGQKISKEMYNYLLETLKKCNAKRISNNLLIGAVGLLKPFYDNLYSSGTFKKTSEFIPREVYGDKWELLEKTRKETIGTEIYAKRLGLKIIGSSKTHGGPIFFSSSLDDVVDKYLE